MRVCQFRHFGTACLSLALRQDTAAVSNQSFKHRVACQLRPACLTLRPPGIATPAGRLKHPNMKEPTPAAPQNAVAEIPEDLALEIRRLAHDLSNALEIIVQTSYLLGTVELKEPGSDWLRLLDNGVRKALDINLSLRSYIKTHSPR